jgi:hypothetical protein
VTANNTLSEKMQKQTATIISAELPGFQSLAENLSPKDITPLMQALHTLIENTIRWKQ